MKKESLRNFDVWVIFLMSASMVVLIAVAPKTQPQPTAETKFVPGNCIIEVNQEKEYWEADYPKYIILELGNYSYRVDVYRNQLDVNYGATEKILFSKESLYQKVSCNEGN